MANENRKNKDTVFTDLFYSDKYAKRNLLSLYNALFGDDLQDENLIEQVRLENVLFQNMQNDISFLVKDRKIVLGEHQSTINQNMPLRSLMYIGREYEKIVDPDKRYARKLIKIPTPEFITFYNGEEDLPTESVLRLSDAFIDKEEDSALELCVRVININHPKGHVVLNKCSILNEYSAFVEETRKFKGDEASLEKAVKSCIKKGILEEYLKRKGSEVVNMLMMEYDYEKDMRAQRAEAEEIGEEKGKAKERDILKNVRSFLKKEPNAKNHEIANACGCSEEEAKDAKEFLESLL